MGGPEETEKCHICNLEITDDEYDEECNFCEISICEKCFRKLPPNDKLMYGYVCQKCYT